MMGGDNGTMFLHTSKARTLLVIRPEPIMLLKFTYYSFKNFPNSSPIIPKIIPIFSYYSEIIVAVWCSCTNWCDRKTNL